MRVVTATLDALGASNGGHHIDDVMSVAWQHAYVDSNVYISYIEALFNSHFCTKAMVYPYTTHAR